MTAKDKAKELVLKMVDTYNVTSDFCYDSTAIACAIIAVEEILNAHLFDLDEKEYWQEVRIEIENL
jgi:hypothetical protein